MTQKVQRNFLSALSMLFTFISLYTEFFFIISYRILFSLIAYALSNFLKKRDLLKFTNLFRET